MERVRLVQNLVKNQGALNKYTKYLVMSDVNAQVIPTSSNKQRPTYMALTQ